MKHSNLTSRSGQGLCTLKKRSMLGKLALLGGLALLTSATPSLAQYYPYPPQHERPYYGPNPYYGGGGGGGYYQPYRPVVIGNICVTSRGSCRTRPRPENSSCGCDIPGFGPKRGAVVANPGW